MDHLRRMLAMVKGNRKYRQALEVTLRTRFVVMTNEVPKFADRSGALVW